jgi:hypothetical protein
MRNLTRSDVSARLTDAHQLAWLVDDRRVYKGLE